MHVDASAKRGPASDYNQRRTDRSMGTTRRCRSQGSLYKDQPRIFNLQVHEMSNIGRSSQEVPYIPSHLAILPEEPAPEERLYSSPGDLEKSHHRTCNDWRCKIFHSLYVTKRWKIPRSIPNCICKVQQVESHRLQDHTASGRRARVCFRW